MADKALRLLIISGLSGAGKTQALRCLEDLGYFCVDNLPPKLLPGFLELLRQPVEEGQPVTKAAVVMDIRGGWFFSGLAEALGYLDREHLDYEILFLEAADEVLVRRYKETRRRHPLSSEGRILEGIIEERERLQELRGRASKIIDTSDLGPTQLREEIIELFAAGREKQMAVSVVSFGFKYGIPLDADLVLDVRFLPNPHYIPALRPFTGHDRCVEDYVLASPVALEFLERSAGLLSFLLPNYAAEGKSHLVIAIGCTGGQHRSVTLANKLAEQLKSGPYRVTVKHRDIMRHQEPRRR